MEKLLFKPYDKEHMRMAMLKHEATFKEQVYELHRLYQIQKIMMRNMGEQIRKVDPAIRAVDHSIIDKINIRDETDGRDDHCTGAAALEVIDESEIELTLGPTSYGGRRRSTRARRPETGPIGSDSGPSFSSSSTGSSQMNRTTGANNNNNSNNSYETTTRLPETASYNGIGGGVVEEEMRVKHPPWLFQVLSLNMST